MADIVWFKINVLKHGEAIGEEWTYKKNGKLLAWIFLNYSDGLYSCSCKGNKWENINDIGTLQEAKAKIKKYLK